MPGPAPHEPTKRAPRAASPQGPEREAKSYDPTRAWLAAATFDAGATRLSPGAQPGFAAQAAALVPGPQAEAPMVLPPRVISGMGTREATVGAIRRGHRASARALAATSLDTLATDVPLKFILGARHALSIVPLRPPGWDARMAGATKDGAPGWQRTALEMDVAYREWVYWLESVTVSGGLWAQLEAAPTEVNKRHTERNAGYALFASDEFTSRAVEIIHATD